MEIFNTKLKKQRLPEKALWVRIDRCARSSGLLAFLSPEDLQTLIALLTFVDASGRCDLSARTLGQSLNLSEKQAQKRLKRLCGISWHGKPLLMRENGREMGRFTPTGYRLPEVEGLKIVPNNTLQASERYGGGLRDHGSTGGSGVREAHAPPLPVGEVDIRKGKSTSGTRLPEIEGKTPDRIPVTGNSCVVAGNINKEHTEEDEDGFTDGEKRKQILRELLKCGVSGSIASEMLDKYPAERIAGQLKMLPFRNAKEPAAMLVKAIKDDWTAPAAYMGRQRKQAERKTQLERESAEAERRSIWHKRVEAAKAKLPPDELQRITGTAREKVRNALKGALHGHAPERLVKVEVNRIIAEKYMNHG